MASDKQINANRANAQKSTGPKTDTGRAAIRGNSLRHGLAAETIVLTEEDKAQFEETRTAFEAEYWPVGPTENLLVQQIVVAAWRLRRVRAMSTGFVEYALDEGHARVMRDLNDSPLPYRLGCIAAQHPARLDLLARYESRIERTFYRALHELERIQERRRAQPAPPVENTSAEQTQSGAANPAQVSPQPPLAASPGPQLVTNLKNPRDRNHPETSIY